MKNQKGFIQIPLSIVIILLVISVSIGVILPNIAKAVTFNMSKILFPICIPKNEPDPETGCRVCGDNARAVYEQCRQAYYLKKQTELLESQQSSQEILTEKEQIITEKEQFVNELESKNLKFQELLEEQNKQIEELIQGLEQQSQTINVLTASLQNTNLLNVGLFIILGIFLACLILFFIKRKRKKYEQKSVF